MYHLYVSVLFSADLLGEDVAGSSTPKHHRIDSQGNEVLEDDIVATISLPRHTYNTPCKA